MKIINKIILSTTILIASPIIGMQNLESLRKSITSYTESMPAATKKSVGSPEEQRFIMQVKDWTSSDRKFSAFNLVIRESLKPASAFIKTLFNIVLNNQDIKSIKTLTGHDEDKSVESASWSPDGNFALSGSSDDTIKLWDMRDKQHPNTQAIATFTGHKNTVYSVSWSPDGNFALSGSRDETIKLWDLRNKNNPNTQAIATLNGNNGSVNSVSWSPDGNYALSASGDGQIKLWDLTDKQNPNPNAIATLTGHNGTVKSVSWSPDGNYALSGSRDNTIKLWALRNKQNPKPQAIATLNGHDEPIFSVSWSPDGNYAISGSQDETIKLWDLRNKQNPNKQPIATLTCHDDIVNSVSWRPDGNYALSGSYDTTIKLWDMRFINLPKQLTKLVDSHDGMLQYLLLSSILEFRKNQQTETHKLYTESPKPFTITYPKLKKLFNGLHDVLKESLINKNYVVLK